MLNQIEKLEKNTEETPILTAAELREVLPAGFVKKLSRMDELIARQCEILESLESNSDNAMVFEQADEKLEGLRAQFEAGNKDKEAFSKESKVILQGLEDLISEETKELRNLAQRVAECKKYMVKVDDDQDGYGTYVECEWDDSGSMQPRIKVQIGSFYYNGEGQFIKVGTDHDEVTVVINIGEAGVEDIRLNRFGDDKYRPSEGHEAQESIKEDVLEFLQLAAKVDSGEYVNVRDVKLEASGDEPELQENSL